MTTNNFAFKENFTPVSSEVEVFDLLTVDGQLPKQLKGVLYRNGPNPQFPPMGELHHWFLGEGMVHAIKVEDGKVSYQNKWVRTPQYLTQKMANERLVPTSFEELFGGKAKMPASLSCTNAVWHGEKLYALDESMLPMLLNPETLEAEGYTDFAGKYVGPLTAHPKVDPDTGDLIVFGYQTDGPGTKRMALGQIDKEGNLKSYDTFEVPVCCMVHDFVLTTEHVLFPLCPGTIDLGRIAQNKPVIAWEPGVGNHIGIMERSVGVSSMRWFKGPSSFLYHPMNGYSYEKDGKKYLIADVMLFNSAPLFPDTNGAYHLPWIEKGMAKLVRWTFDLSSEHDGYDEEIICYIEGEFPRIDERYLGKKYSIGFYIARVERHYSGCGFDTLIKVNVDTGKIETWRSPHDVGLLEPIFVPRSNDAEEGDGWIITLGYNKEREASDFLVFDANSVSAGPIARVELPVRVPYGFHGSWRDNRPGIN